MSIFRANSASKHTSLLIYCHVYGVTREERDSGKCVVALLEYFCRQMKVYSSSRFQKIFFLWKNHVTFPAFIPSFMPTIISVP
mmetsp:Transcript_14469/g.21619  ORF Transcript_14469/g.21619 Transcript_14469/m.21619 type:complete len:83 (+) Transcript_14469:215-463(+)